SPPSTPPPPDDNDGEVATRTPELRSRRSPRTRHPQSPKSEFASRPQPDPRRQADARQSPQSPNFITLLAAHGDDPGSEHRSRCHVARVDPDHGGHHGGYDDGRGVVG